MQAFLRILVATVALVQYAWAELVLNASVPSVVRNEEPASVVLSLTGELENAAVSEVRTVLQTPGKRRPKPYANFAQTSFESAKDAHAILLNLAPVYSVPTKTYLLSYSVLVNLGEDEEAVWVDSEAAEVKFVDPEVSFLKFVVAGVVLIASVLTLLYASFYMANPGWWESVLPVQLHGFLPKPGKKRA